MDAKVTAYIESQPSPQKEICQELRKIMLATFPGIDEEMKWGVPCYGKGKYYFAALRDHVNLGFTIAGLTKEQIAQFKGTGKTMRHLPFATLDEINADQVAETLRQIP